MEPGILDVLRVTDEPTVGIDCVDCTIYALSGGPFDVSSLELQKGAFQVKSTNLLAEHILMEFTKKSDFDLAADRMAIQRIREAADKTKMELSSTSQTEINLPFIANTSGPKHINIKLLRSSLRAARLAHYRPVQGSCGCGREDF